MEVADCELHFFVILNSIRDLVFVSILKSQIVTSSFKWLLYI